MLFLSMVTTKFLASKIKHTSTKDVRSFKGTYNSIPDKLALKFSKVVIMFECQRR